MAGGDQGAAFPERAAVSQRRPASHKKAGVSKTTIQLEPGVLDINALMPRDRCTLTVVAGPEAGRVFALGAEPVLVGRSDECDVCLDDAGVSGVHASITRSAGHFHLVDQGSTNGTFVAGERLEGPHRIQDGERLRLGMSTLLRAELHTRLEQEAACHVWESAVKDALTELHNRRYFDDRAEAELAYADRHRVPLSALLVDVDHFKIFNDTWGHAVGDEVLRAVARALADTVRREDVLARYGGEEFVVLMRGTGREGARALGDRVRQAVERTRVPHAGQDLQVTISVGASTFDSEHTYATIADLVKAADGALYRAKAAGRNRVCHAT
ncbi:MAG: GGDEF domain-containing protein [Deltaproteobacteria bacterium]|nr:GGDEF domain-containing protein [Deltaproteobacteria bacterium]